MIEAIPFPIMIVGRNQQVAEVNAALRDLLGADVAGRHFIAALRQPLLVAAVEAAFATGQPGRARFLRRSEGHETLYDVTIRPHDGQVVLSFEDHTAAQEIGQLRRDFVANVSHELRTPLTALFGFIETLRGPARDDAAARDRFLAIMEREATRMIRLVDDLLSLSKVEEDERRRPSEPVVLGDLLRTALAELDPVVQSAGARVTLHDDSAGLAVPGDPRQLRQVIGNLIENAVKYGGPDNRVTVALSAVGPVRALRGDGVTLEVSDTGPGIPEHHIPRLTERFYRVDSHRSREVGGTGLGLAIVKHIVNRHRGRLVITSTPGAGTRVSVTLPAGTGPAPPAIGE